MTKVRQVLKRATVESGQILRRALLRPKRIAYKGRANLVTATDRQAEKKIIQIIKRVFPDHEILAEESAKSEKRLTGPHQWIIDPVDGTTNFAHSYPQAAVSIAYEENGVVKMGAVYNPFVNELFWAEKGKGAYLNGKRIRVSKAPSLHSALLVTGFPYDRFKRASVYMKVVQAFLRTTHGIRRLGSAALDMCFVACGRFDGYWEVKLKPWDQAAGYLIAKEAGARCTNFSNAPLNIYKKETLVTNGLIHSAMIRVIRKYL